MILCTRDNLTDLLHAQYMAACEEQNPGLVERTIEAVSREIGDALSYRSPQPWPAVPELVRHIAAVFAAYRVVKAITTVVASEASADNEWIPLQQEWKYARELLEDIIKGRLKLPLEEAHPDREDAAVVVVAPRPHFDLRGL